MPTKKPRINVTPTKQMFIVIRQLAEQDDVSLSTKLLQLAEQAIEMDEIEDAYFSAIADKRLSDGSEFISHDEFWNDIQKLQD